MGMKMISSPFNPVLGLVPVNHIVPQVVNYNMDHLVFTQEAKSISEPAIPAFYTCVSMFIL